MRNLPASSEASASICALQSGNGRSQVGIGGVPELLDERMSFQCLLNDPPLNAFAAPVNEPNLTKPRLVRGIHILFDNRFDIPGSEGVQVEGVLYGDSMKILNSQFPTPNARVPTVPPLTIHRGEAEFTCEIEP